MGAVTAIMVAGLQTVFEAATQKGLLPGTIVLVTMLRSNNNTGNHVKSNRSNSNDNDRRVMVNRN